MKAIVWLHLWKNHILVQQSTENIVTESGIKVKLMGRASVETSYIVSGRDELN